jgi:Xaa-Pro aminopeptidase
VQHPRSDARQEDVEGSSVRWDLQDAPQEGEPVGVRDQGEPAVETRIPEGTVGAQLDGFARRALWEVGLDYGHGTGHGVGVYLSVHEGPHGISPRSTVQPLKPGMICSNEPGYYKTGEYGIRIENLVVVRETPKPDGAEKPMLSFETITLAPIDLALVEVSLLTAEERAWLNGYHAKVRTAVAPAFAGDREGSAWLERATRPI